MQRSTHGLARLSTAQFAAAIKRKIFPASAIFARLAALGHHAATADKYAAKSGLSADPTDWARSMAGVPQPAVSQSITTRLAPARLDLTRAFFVARSP